jgi:hypothetical protein
VGILKGNQMGTRSLTFVYEGNKPILNMYRQFDGYRTGHGRDLADFIDGMVIVNGFSSNDTRKIANGMGCFAAQLVANFKDGAGGFYIHPVDEDNCGQDYDYHIYEDHIHVHSFADEIFNGTWEEFVAWARSEEGENV